MNDPSPKRRGVALYLGVEIGGTKLQLGVADARGRLIALVRRRVNRAAGAAGIRRQILTLAPPLLQRYRVRAIGVGFGGPYDNERQRAVTSHQIAGWDNFPVQQWFVRQFGLPAAVDNDQNCAALAEARCGAGRGRRRVFYVTVGTGIGGGLVLDGKLYNGRRGAAEIGHMTLPVPLPAAGRGAARPRMKFVTVESVAAGLAIERGVSTVAQAGRYVGWAVANAIALINPDIVIIGGGVARAGRRFWQPLRRMVERLVFHAFRGNAPLVQPALGQAVVVVGAALLAADQAQSSANARAPTTRRNRR